ncbi:MAG TPA: hypothetical protein VGN32_01100 [Ktedonobacterales bacterium]|jgi:hypothetical protein|nr:hypothetical protein [Ktedonobacterales bacterium]
MKIAILLLSIAAIVLGIIGYSQIYQSGAPCLQYTSDPTAYQLCIHNASTRVGSGAGIGFLVLLVAGVAELIGWILGLVSSATQRRWGWFVVILLFSPLTSLLYGFFGPADAPLFRRAGAGALGPGLAVGGFVAPPAEMPPGMCWQCGGRVKENSVICYHCGATQPPTVAGPSQVTQLSGFDPSAHMGAFPTVKNPVLGMGQDGAQPPAGYPAGSYSPGAYGAPDPYGSGAYDGPNPYDQPPNPGYGPPPNPYGPPPHPGSGAPPDPYSPPPDPYGPPNAGWRPR